MGKIRIRDGKKSDRINIPDPQHCSQRIKIHWLGYRFSRVWFPFGNNKHSAKVSRRLVRGFVFFEIFKIHRLVWILPMDFWLF
jgi:hypothetical protein